MRVRRICLIAVQVLSSAGLLAQGPGAPPQFRAGVELIQLDVAVLDDKRVPVRGMTAADFTVLDNGVATPIRAFTPVELAARTPSTEAVWAADVAPDVVTNQVDQQDGRLVIILMDRSIPRAQPTIVARKIATAAVEALGPDDLAAVISTNNAAVQNPTIQNLTANRARLLRAINSSDPSTGISVEAQEIPTMGKQDPLSDGRCLCGLCVLETITRVADAVQSAVRRRKVLFFIGSNVIWQSSQSVMATGADVGCEVPLKDARTAMFAAVDRANLTVHAIDPQGLINLGPQTRAAALNRSAAKALEASQTETTDAITNRQNLGVLPARTGGRTVVGRNNPEQTVPEMFRESEVYYVLGIERAASDRPDGTRSIEVKVGRAGMRAYAQRRYATPTLATTSSTQDVLNRLLPSAGLPLAMAVAAFAGPASAKSVVRVNIDTGAFVRSNGSAVPLEVGVMATDQTGRPVASVRQTSTITAAGPVSDSRIEVNVQSHLELPPGEYGIRVAVSDSVAGKVASVFSDVTVAQFGSMSLSLSGVTVDIASTSSPAPVPTTRRVFRRQDRVRALLQIYQGTERSETIVPVSMRVQILDAKGGAVRDQSLPFTEKAFTNRRADCVITLPVANLPPGDYLLKLEASADRQTAGRALRFAVE